MLVGLKNVLLIGISLNWIAADDFLTEQIDERKTYVKRDCPLIAEEISKNCLKMPLIYRLMMVFFKIKLSENRITSHPDSCM